MTFDEANALKNYIDAKIEEAFAAREEGADGYRCSHPHETKAVEKAWEAVLLNCSVDDL